MRHLTPDELVDAAEGTPGPGAAARRAHLETCESCRREVAHLSRMMSEAGEVGVPDPSPLFWQHFSRRVREAIDAEPVPASSRRRWLPGNLRWSAWVPIGALAALVAALVLSVPRDSSVPEPLPNEIAAAETLAADDHWVLVADLVGDVDWDTAHAAGLTVEPGAVDRAVLQLSADEQAELARLLRAELLRTKS